MSRRSGSAVTSQGPALPSPVLTFLGAAGTVTGSRFLIDTDRAHVCWSTAACSRGSSTLRLRNWEPFPVDPLDASTRWCSPTPTSTTSGTCPRCVRDGFRGAGVRHAGTAALAAIVLPDCGHLQEEEAAYANRRGFSKHHPALPLYTEADAADGARAIRARRVRRRGRGRCRACTSRFRPAGHILGSSMVHVRLGRPRRPHGACSAVISAGPTTRCCSPRRPSDAPTCVVMESTYGNRRHDDAGAASSASATRSPETLRRGGTVLIPAFAVDRTEVVLFHLRELVEAGRDPVGCRSTSTRRWRSTRSASTARRSPRARPTSTPSWRRWRDPFDPGQLVEVRDVEESKALARSALPGDHRVGLGHGDRWTGRCTTWHGCCPIRATPSSSSATRRRAPEGDSSPTAPARSRCSGRYVRVRAEVVDLGAVLGPRRPGRAARVARHRVRPPPDAVYVVHGEGESSAELRDRLDQDLDLCAVVPRHLERVRLD